MASSACYNIIVFGEPGVGKTCFVDQFCYGEPFVTYIPGDSISIQEIVVGERRVKMTLMDLSTSFLKPEIATQHPEWAEKMLREADGVVLLYDVTNAESFEYITGQAYNFLWRCRRLGLKTHDDAARDARQSFGCVLAGNKMDLVAARPDKRAISQSLAEDWACTQGFKNIELDSLSKSASELAHSLLARSFASTKYDSLVGNGPEQALTLLVKNIWKLEQMGLLETKETMQLAAPMEGKGKGNSIRNAIRDALKTTAGS